MLCCFLWVGEKRREKQPCFQDLENQECRPCFGSKATFLKDCVKKVCLVQMFPLPSVPQPPGLHRPVIYIQSSFTGGINSWIYTISASCQWLVHCAAILYVIRAGGGTCMCMCVCTGLHRKPVSHRCTTGDVTPHIDFTVSDHHAIYGEKCFSMVRLQRGCGGTFEGMNM